MMNTVNRTPPEQGRFRRALAAAGAFLQSLDHTNFDHTLDRIEHLEREVGLLREELRQGGYRANVDAHDTSVAALER